MWAVSRKSLIDFVLFTGVHEGYPEWFKGLLIDGRIVQDGNFGYYYIDADGSACDIVPGSDVVMMNRWGMYKVTKASIFYESMQDVEPFVAAAKNSWIEFFYYQNLDTEEEIEAEDWYLASWSEGYIFEEYGGPYYIDAVNGAVPFVESDIIIKNEDGDMINMPTEDFHSDFYTVG